MAHLQEVKLSTRPICEECMLTDSNRTLARSQQIEAEERANVRRPPVRNADSFTDDPEDQLTAATVIEDDQIDFLNHESGAEYRDEFSDEDNVFRYGDADEEGAIGLDKQPPQR